MHLLVNSSVYCVIRFHRWKPSSISSPSLTLFHTPQQTADKNRRRPKYLVAQCRRFVSQLIVQQRIYLDGWLMLKQGVQQRLKQLMRPPPSRNLCIATTSACLHRKDRTRAFFAGDQSSAGVVSVRLITSRAATKTRVVTSAKRSTRRLRYDLVPL